MAGFFSLSGRGQRLFPLMDNSLLRQECRNLFGISLTNEQLSAFEEYTELLIHWNRRISLTAIRDRESIRVRHFLDSLSCLTVMPALPGRVVDVGSGAGFPGLVLKIVRPEIRLTLVESVAKKAGFCRRVIDALGLSGVDVVVDRAENLGRAAEHREVYDWALARALAPMPVLAEYLLPFVRPGGRALAQKGSGGLEEAKQAETAVEILGGALQSHRRVALPGMPKPHWLLVFTKLRPTPSPYPRRAGVPAKRPL